MMKKFKKAKWRKIEKKWEELTSQLSQTTLGSNQHIFESESLTDMCTFNF